MTTQSQPKFFKPKKVVHEIFPYVKAHLPEIMRPDDD